MDGRARFRRSQTWRRGREQPGLQRKLAGKTRIHLSALIVAESYVPLPNAKSKAMRFQAIKTPGYITICLTPPFPLRFTSYMRLSAHRSNESRSPSGLVCVTAPMLNPTCILSAPSAARSAIWDST